MSDIQIFTTGGTIDKIYFDAASSFQVGQPQIGRVLEGAGVSANYAINSLMRKDSLELTEADRQLIREAVEACDSARILITHGTDTMVDTARVLAGVGDKTIVLTGAMQPARFHETDAIFNIGFAMGAVNCLPPGIYLAMNGQVFDPDHVHKNREAGRFEPD